METERSDAGAPKAVDIYQRLSTKIGRVIRGQADTIRKLLAAFTTGGHVLLEDCPGTRKTTLAKALARSINAEFKRKERDVPAPRAGADSDYYLLEKRLNELGFSRKPWESPATWMQRIESELPSHVSPNTLKPVLQLHYRYRFDPKGISVNERLALEDGVRSRLEDLEKR